MGVYPETLLLVQLNMKETSQDESIWKQTSMEEEEQQQEQQEAIAKSFNRRRSSSNSLMKKRRSRSRSSTRIEQRVSKLRNLVPDMNNNNHEDSVGSLEQLFTQTADYILSLQTRVRFMKNLVDVLSASSSSSNDRE